MKLYLSSHMIGDFGNVLLEMAGGAGMRMAVIGNALDYMPVEDRLEYARTQLDPVTYFGGLGFDPSPLDLRIYFGRSAALRDVLLRHRVLWALGGNAFLLRRAMRESGFDDLIHDLLAEGIVYAGWSAGACVAGTDLRPIAIMDDPNVTAVGYASADPIWSGLGLVNGAIIPHFDSDHPEKAAAAKAVEWSLEHKTEHVRLRDGEVLVQDGAERKLMSRTLDVGENEA